MQSKEGGQANSSERQMQVDMRRNRPPGSTADNAIPPGDSAPGWEPEHGTRVVHSETDGFVKGR